MLLLPLAATTAFLGGGTAEAQTFTWDGGGANGNWQSSPGNWVGDTAPSPASALVFAGTTNLSTNNDYAANTEFSGITFATGAGAFTLAGNTLNLRGNVVNASSTAQTISLGIQLLQNSTFNLTGALTHSGVISDGGTAATAFGITKLGAATLTLTGANTYAGATTVNQGALALNFNATGGATSNIINASSALVFGNATNVQSTALSSALNLAGVSNGTTTQSFASTAYQFGSSTITTTRGGTTGTVALNLGDISHSAGALAFFSAGTGTTISTTSSVAAQGILGGYARVGTNYATVNGSGNIVAYAGYTTDTAPAASNTAANYQYTAATTTTLATVTLGGTAGATFDASTVQFTDPASRTLDLNTDTFRLGASGGIWRNVGTSATLGTITVQNGTLTAGGAANVGGEIVLTADGATGNGGTTSSGSLNNAINITANVANNGTGVVSLVKNGTQQVTMAGTANTYTGNTYVLEGRLRSTVAGNLGTGDIYVTDGLTTPGQLVLSPTVANGTYANNLFLKGFGVSVTTGTGANTSGQEGALILNNGVTVSGRVTLLGNTSISAFNSATGGTISGQITGNYSLLLGTPASAQYQQGNVTLSSTPGSNNFTGGLILSNPAGSSGTQQITVVLGANEQIPNGVGTGDLTFVAPATSTQTVTLNLNGRSETINGLNSTAGNAFSTNKVITGTAASTLTLGDNNANGSFIGDITGAMSLVKIGTGTQTFGSGSNANILGQTANTNQGSNTYTGGTTISGGKLSLVNTQTAGATTVVGGLSSATGTGAVALVGNNGTTPTASTTTIMGTGFSSGLLTVTAGGRIAPGVNTSGANANFGVAGTLSLGTSTTVGGMTLTNANLDFDLAAANTLGAGINDLVLTRGALTLGTLNFTFNPLEGVLDINAGDTYTLISGATSLVNTNQVISYSVIGGGYTASFSTDANNSLLVSFTSVPEPSTWVVGCLSMVVGAFHLRRRFVGKQNAPLV